MRSTSRNSRTESRSLNQCSKLYDLRAVTMVEVSFESAADSDNQNDVRESALEQLAEDGRSHLNRNVFATEGQPRLNQ